MLKSVSLVLLCALCAVTGTTTKYYSYEEDVPGTFIGNLSRDLKIDPTEDPNTIFRFMQKTNSSLIHMRRSDGLLTVGDRIDREGLCQRSPRCLLTFDVVVFSKEKFHLIHVEIHVKDINDHSPRFPHNDTNLEISENVAVGTRFPLDLAVDWDVGNNYIQSYQLSHSSHFGIEMRSRENGVKFAELVLVKELDREAEDSYTLQVTASDGGSPPKSGSMTVYVKVLDSNDNSPKFERNSIKVELHEDAPVGFLLLKVHASDLDNGANGEVRYDFVDGSQDEVKDTFHIDPFSGAVTLKSHVDFETRRSYELNIQAYDLGVNSIPSTCKVLAEIVDVNDNAPEISIKPMTTSMREGMAVITEAAAVESFVALISTSDRDAGANGYVRVSLHGHEHFKLQQAYGETFMVVTTTALDREKTPEYNLTVVAEDLGSPPFRTIKQYTIRVSDENDNPPLFSKPVYEVSVMENKAPGSYITTVVARDLDAGVNGKVTYELLDGEAVGGAKLSSFVSIDPVSGSLHTVRSLDYESEKQIEVSILATDGGSPQLSSTALIRVKVVDQNDNWPFITHPILLKDSADVPIPYNAPAGYLALRVKARDMDEGVNSELTFSILEDKEMLFSINRNTGEVVLKYGLTFTVGDALVIKVAVRDSGRSPLSCSATFRFLVTEMRPAEGQIVVLLESSDEEETSDVDASLIVIALLGAGCALLLVAIVAVALSRKHNQRHGSCGAKKNGTDGLLKKSPLSTNSRDSTRSNIYIERNPQEPISSTRDDSSYSYEERSTDSDNKVFRPLLGKANFEPVAIWQGDRYTLQMSGIGSTDQTSVKDSGKGDSDFNDSDSDISGVAGQKIHSNIQPRANGSFHPGSADGFGKACGMPPHPPSAQTSSGGYTIAFTRASTYGHPQANHQRPSPRDYGYSTVLPRVGGPRQAPMSHRMGTLPSHFYLHPHDAKPQFEQQPQTTENLTEVVPHCQPATSF